MSRPRKPRDYLLTECVDLLAASRDVTKKYIDQLRYAVDRYTRFLEFPASVTDLNPESVNRWLVAMQAEQPPLSVQTIRMYRRNLLVVWHDCIDGELTDVSPRRVRKIKAPRLRPDAWKPDEMRRLIAESQKTTGVFRTSRVSRPAFWKALLLTAWDTGLRLGDLMALTTEQVRGQSQFWHTQNKTGHPILCVLRPETGHAIEATYPPDRGLVFRDALKQHFASDRLREFVKAAGVSPGGFKKIRKSSATAMEIACPGSATAHLGHLTPDMAFKHYLDQSQIQQNKRMAPALLLADGVDE